MSFSDNPFIRPSKILQVRVEVESFMIYESQLVVDPFKNPIIRRLSIKTSLQNVSGELAAWTINRIQLLTS